MTNETTILDEKINGGNGVPAHVDPEDENDEGEEEGVTQTAGSCFD
jgi:hypothetical protein